MVTKLRILASLSVVLIGLTYYWSSREVEQMFVLEDPSNDSKIAPMVDRKRIDQFKAQDLMAHGKSVQNNSDSENVLSKKLLSFEASLQKLSQQCSQNLVNVLDKVDLVDPNADFYKENDKVFEKFKEIKNLIKGPIASAQNLEFEIIEYVQKNDLNEVQMNKVVQIIDNQIDVCTNKDLDTYMMTAVEALSLQGWPEDSRERMQNEIILMASSFLAMRSSAQAAYRGIGLVRLGIQYGVFQAMDKDYIGEMHFMLEERRDELEYQFRRTTDRSTKSQLLNQEFKWRAEFQEEFLDYIFDANREEVSYIY